VNPAPVIVDQADARKAARAETLRTRHLHTAEPVMRPGYSLVSGYRIVPVLNMDDVRTLQAAATILHLMGRAEEHELVDDARRALETEVRS
jgi:hypothetical protein